MPMKHIFCDCHRNVGHFLCGVENVKRFVKIQPKKDKQNVGVASPLEKFIRMPMSMILQCQIQGCQMFLTRSSQTLIRKEPKWQISSQTLCLRFDDDVTMFTQQWYDLFAKLAKYGPWPKLPAWLRPRWCTYFSRLLLLGIQDFFVKVDDKHNT